jgi:hypothetical protein
MEMEIGIPPLSEDGAFFLFKAKQNYKQLCTGGEDAKIGTNSAQRLK